MPSEARQLGEPGSGAEEPLLVGLWSAHRHLPSLIRASSGKRDTDGLVLDKESYGVSFFIGEWGAKGYR